MDDPHHVHICTAQERFSAVRSVKRTKSIEDRNKKSIETGGMLEVSSLGMVLP
jgi:hypothetical protein